MKIAVCGWYFHEKLYASLWRVNQKYPVFIIAHGDHELLKICDLPYMVKENKGLEWGAYNYYIKNIWDENDSVLFMHDDMELLPFVKDYEIIPPEFVFNFLSKIECDQAYIFQTRRDEVLNFGHHGRMVFMSERLLRILKRQGDLPFDKNNEGYTGQDRKPENVKFHNYGIMAIDEKFREIQESRPGWKLLQKIYAPSIDMGYRGKFGNQKRSIMSHLELPL